ncbi:C-Jun-amino-terminal kinase-interacting 4-like [Schistosoma japonicum]|nr:C-Jun-amino-terminal kinase-interacting 4-like [Schistosoma japonicum]
MSCGKNRWNVVHNLLPHIKMMARCCGCGNVVHNLLPHIKMMARCCGCKLIGGDELCMKNRWECRAQPSSPYKDDGEMLWV